MWNTKILVTGLVLALSSATFYGCSEKVQNESEVFLYMPDEKKKENEDIETTKVEKKTYVQTAFVNASVYYTKQKHISFNVENAQLKSIKVKNGDKVKKGDLIATYKVNLQKSDVEWERLEIENERNAFNASYKAFENQVMEQERIIKNMKDGKEKKAKQYELKQMKEQLKQEKSQERSIIKKEKAFAKKINDSKKTKLYSKYDGIVMNTASVDDVESSDEDEFNGEGDTIVTLRTEDDFMIGIGDIETLSSTAGFFRYNSEVTVSLGGDRNDIRHKLKGKIVSADNLAEEEEDYGGRSDLDRSILIQVSEADRKKYDFKKNNVYIEYERIRVENCLVVEKKAIYTEVVGEDKKYYVLLVEDGNLFKRYIVLASTEEELKEEEWILQGVEEGQVLAKNASVMR